MRGRARLLTWLPMLLAATIACGCTTTRNFTISSRPAGATVKIDGLERGTTPLHEALVFSSSKPRYRVDLARQGYKDQAVDLSATADENVLVDLRPLTKRLTFAVQPFPAKISVDGKPLANGGRVSSTSAELEFTLDEKGKWTTHKVTAERPGFQPLERTVTWTDPDPNYMLVLEPMRKELTITTAPPGAKLVLDDEEIGTSPLTYRGPDGKGVPFYIDPQTEQWNEYRLRISKAGYDDVPAKISWDDGKVEYAIDLKPKAKTVRILSAPAGAVVTVDGKELPRDAAGVSSISLTFPPVDQRGELKTYTALLTKKTADSEWEPKTIVIGWEGGKGEYTVTLKEVKTTPVLLVTPEPKRSDEGWSLVPRRTTTLAMKDVNEGTGKGRPVKLTNLPKGTVIDSLAISPDGARLVFSALSQRGESDLRSQLLVIRTDGTGGVESYSDGRSLDIQPSFTPDGKQIVFSSNRGGRRMSVWMMSAAGAPGITQLTTDDNNDLWASIDPARRLYYQAFVDTRPDPRLFMTELGKTTRTDLTQAGGMQPRVSPDAGPDTGTILFTATNEKTGKRDIFRVSTKGGNPENLTNTPDVDEFDPTWSPDGSKIAFVSDRGVDEDGRNNYDIWLLDLSRPGQPVQITNNGSWDDCPCWDAAGGALYFRSNRGGEWAIWKIAVK